MMALTADGQVEPQLVAARDARYGVSSSEKQSQRQHLTYPNRIDPGADHWQGGEAWQLNLEKVPVKK